MSDERLTALDVCAGAGGLSLGLQRAGFDVLGLELDEAAVDTHRRHAGTCEIGDVRTWSPPRSFDLVAGGVPCQPFSDAGKRLGLEDPRYLVPDFLRIAREANAQAVLLENVRGLVKNARAFRVVLDAFEAEWLTTWTVVDAADYGVPQHRDRLFVVGFKDPAARAAFQWPLPSHAPPGDILGRPSYVTVRQALGLSGVWRKGLKENAKKGSPGGMRFLDVDAPGYSITVSCQDLLDRPSPCITAGGTEGGGGAEPIANRKQRTELSAALEDAGLADRPATTVQADPRIAVAGHHDRQQNGAVRLTPEQCAILQGFPREWTFTGNKTQQHRQIGNAVPPPLAEAMGRAVRLALGAP